MMMCAAAVTGSEAVRAAPPSSGGPEVTDHPNVLVMVVDDQSYRHAGFQHLAEIQNLDAVEFTRAFTNNPACCPSRATMLTGLYDHHTGVTNNASGGSMDPSATLATWFDDAGYHTALFGKYLNGYPFGEPAPPPGWDQWLAFSDTGYYDFSLIRGNVEETYGADDGIYSTDLLAGELSDMIAAVDRPFFAVLSTWASHGRPRANDTYRGRHSNKRVSLPENFNRLARDAPRWQESFEKVSRRSEKKFIRGQWETLESVDDALASARAALEKRGWLDETVIVFVSDNGMSLGSHRWKKKTCGYEECARVPLLISVPGIAGREEDALVSNVDLAPTLADLAGVATSPVDGESVVPILRGEETSLRRPVLLHNTKNRGTGFSFPTFRGLRNQRWKLLKYAGRGRELYDLRNDPYELKNLAGKARYSERIRALSRRIRELRRTPPS